MPTSVLLAVLAAAGLLALAPALVRRYDADERMAAELEASQARVLERKPRQSTIPGSNPVNGPSEDSDVEESASLLESETPPSVAEAVAAESAEPVDTEPSEVAAMSPWERSGARQGSSVRLEPEAAQDSRYGKENSVGSAQMRAWWQKRHRQVLFTLLALNLAEIAGVIFVGPGFWLGLGVSLALLLAFVRFLRLRVVRSNVAARRAAVRRPVYVPVQSTSARETEGGADDTGIVPGFEDEEPDPDPIPEPAAVSRRRTGGIRGRSYESPANL